MTQLRFDPAEEARLLELPLHPGRSWLGDVRALGAPGKETEVLALWTEADTGLPRKLVFSSDADPGADSLLRSLVQAMFHEGGGSQPIRPGSVAVPAAHVAALNAVLACVGVRAVPLRDSKSLDRLFEDIARGDPAPTSYLEVPGVTPADIQKLFEAATDLWDMAPWEFLREWQLLVVRGLDPSPLYVSMQLTETGMPVLWLHLDQAGIEATANRDREGFQAAPSICLTYAPVEHTPESWEEEIDAHDWPLVEDGPQDLAPVVLCRPGGELPGLDQLELLNRVVDILDRLAREERAPDRPLGSGVREVLLHDGARVEVLIEDLYQVGGGHLSRQQRRKLARKRR